MQFNKLASLVALASLAVATPIELPVVRSLPIVGPILGGLPIVGPILGEVPRVGDLPIVGDIPIVGDLPLARDLPIVGDLPIIGDILGDLPIVGDIPILDPTPASQCTTGNLQCCTSLQSAANPTISLVLGLLGVAVPDVTIPVGVTCSPITVIGASGTSCTAQPVCCTNNSFNGLIALGCTPVNVNL